MLDYLFVGAHPDDEFCVSGLLIKAKQERKRTGVIIFTKGEAGGYASPEVRVAEMQRSASIMGLDYLRILDFVDSNVMFCEETVSTLIDLFIETKPKVIITIHPDDYHPDHKAVSNIVDKAVFVAGLKKDGDHTVWEPNKVMYASLDPRSNSVRPMVILDISEVTDLKMKAVRCHKSQNIAKYVELNDRFNGMLGNVEFGEGFYLRKPLQMNLVSNFIT
ncbi:carbohydrate esterase [Acidaminobacter sp. JC074]|uniref:PIG-L deacetylase family protein n=1 Tax=Acidaminobacter sp. JC074 TaxID=2530199 RepID=UPI001F101F70|nr:PIG-L family deacetylase [Acidaminobacter sp. JC074]MCH4891135.1 carbohydrate esterase [Acidaminobacter sp. JC074]